MEEMPVFNHTDAFIQSLLELHTVIEDRRDAVSKYGSAYMRVVYYGYKAGSQGLQVKLHGEDISITTLCIEFASARDKVFLTKCKNAFLYAVPEGCLADANRAARQSIQECMLSIAELTARNAAICDLVSTSTGLKIWLGGIDAKGKHVVYSHTDLLRAARVRYRPKPQKEKDETAVLDQVKLVAMINHTNGRIAGKELNEFSDDEQIQLRELMLSLACTLNVRIPKLK